MTDDREELHLILPWEDPRGSRTPDLCLRRAGELDGAPLITTDTYFNRFPIGLWRKHTDIDAPLARIVGAKGCPTQIVTAKGVHVTRHPVLIEDDDALVDMAGMDLDADFCWIESTADPERFRAEFYARTPACNPLNLLVGFVVFNHPDRAVFNARLVLDSFPADADVRVLLVDQAGGADFSEVADDPRVTVCDQPNLGGSGGFARIFVEASSSEHTDVIVMDDDTVLGAQTLRRLALLRSYSVQPLALAAQSLNERELRELRSDAERLDVPSFWARPTDWSRSRVDANSRPAVTGLLGDHSPWVCALFPVSLVRGNGFPLPLFIHWDDLEYSWRLRKDRGPSFLWVPGAGVWHEPPSVKSPWTFMSYFDNRNRLIGATVVGLNHRALRKRTHDFWVRALVSHRYCAADATAAAVHDFLAGPQVLSGDQLARAKAAFGGSPVSCDCEVAALDKAAPAKPGSSRVLLAKRLFGPAPSSASVRVPAGQAGDAATIDGYRHVHVHKPYTQDTEALTFSRRALWRSYLKGRVAFAKLRMQRKSAARRWRDEAPQTRSEQAWRSRFGG